MKIQGWVRALAAVMMAATLSLAAPAAFAAEGDGIDLVTGDDGIITITEGDEVIDLLPARSEEESPAEPVASSAAPVGSAEESTPPASEVTGSVVPPTTQAPPSTDPAVIDVLGVSSEVAATPTLEAESRMGTVGWIAAAVVALVVVMGGLVVMRRRAGARAHLHS